MTELTNIFLTSSLTIIGGVIIFTITRFIERFHITPMHKLNQLRGKVSHTIILHKNKFGNPNISDEKRNEIEDDFRKLSSELRSKVYLIKNYRLLSFFRLILPKQNVFKASREIMGLSNSFFQDDYEKHDNRIKIIEESLAIKT